MSATATLFPEVATRGVRPLLKWAGGKTWLAPRLAELYAPHAARTWAEPFCGGLGATLGVNASRAVLGDLNPHLVNVYRQVQRGLVATIPMRNDRAAFDAHRERFNALIRAEAADTPEAAQLFYYLNRTGFNGLCRFNASGLFNVPFGKYATVAYCRDFSPWEAQFTDYAFHCGDFAALPLSGSEFLYADPPYDGTFEGYTGAGFGWQGQVRLAEWLARHPGPVVASNAATARVKDLYSALGFRLAFVEAPRRISCDGNREPVRELLAMKGAA